MLSKTKIISWSIICVQFACNPSEENIEHSTKQAKIWAEYSNIELLKEPLCVHGYENGYSRIYCTLISKNNEITTLKCSYGPREDHKCHKI